MTDMYSSAGDKDLASMSNTTKQISMCEIYNQPKEYFHYPTRQTLCAQRLVDLQLDRADCVDARAFCTSMM